MNTTQTGAACIRNLRTNEAENGKVTLYKCAIDSLYNEGTITLMRNDSQVQKVITKEESQFYMTEDSIKS